MTTLELDIADISEINKQYCHMHYKNGSQESLYTSSIPTAVLQKLFDMVVHKKKFYSEMAKECNEICKTRWEELHRIHCPAQEDMVNADLLQKIDMEQKREKYFEIVNKNSGINEIALMASNNHYKYWRLAKQFASVLSEKGVSVDVKY